MYRIFWFPDHPWVFFRDGDTRAYQSHIKRAGGHECFYSLNVYPEFDATASHYDLAFDFDSTNIARSADDARRIVAYLAERHIPHRLFFSGSKGIHVVVPFRATGVPAREDGGHVTKLFQRHLKNSLDLNTLDTEIHGSKRMWRCVNTVNAKSGLYKIAITLDTLWDTVSSGPQKLLELARTPQPVIPLDAVKEPNLQLSTELKPFISEANEENKKRTQQNEERKLIKLHRVPLCVQGILNDPARVVRQARTWGKPEPSRNALTFIAATFLKDHMGATEQEANAVLNAEWQQRVARISSSSFSTIARSTKTCVESVFASNHSFSCANAVSKGCACTPGCPLYTDARQPKP